MANIVIRIREDVDANASLLLKLKQVLNAAPVEIKKALKKGAILLEEELFMNDHEEVAQKLMNVVSLLKDSKVSFSIHEIGEGHLEENADLDFWEISEETMSNILEDFLGSVQRWNTVSKNYEDYSGFGDNARLIVKDR